MKIAIIGGGIIGLCSAYYLHRAEHEVKVFDTGNITEGCSHGNAGLIVPSHIIPLAAPGMISKGLRWMFNAESPFYVKPRLDSSLMKWGWQFYRAATPKHVTESIGLLRDLNHLSKSCYAELTADFNFAYKENGLLVLYKTVAAEAEEIEIATLANEHEVVANCLSAAAIQAMEPELKLDILGGVFYPGDAQLNPGHFMEQLLIYLEQSGVVFHKNTEVRGFEIQGQRIQKIIAGQHHFKPDEVVLAAGSWSQQIAKQLSLRLPVQAGKGYSITLDKPTKQPRYSSILTEAKVAVTPMNGQLRFAGTMEIGSVESQINTKRVQGILKAIPRYLPDFDIPMPAPENIWHGLRPCSPDGLPYIGRSKKYSNLTIATGHAMMGVSLAPATGLLLSQIIQYDPLSINIDRLSPDRFV